jgi:hypothetical protein
MARLYGGLPSAPSIFTGTVLLRFMASLNHFPAPGCGADGMLLR